MDGRARSSTRSWLSCTLHCLGLVAIIATAAAAGAVGGSALTWRALQTPAVPASAPAVAAPALQLSSSFRAVAYNGELNVVQLYRRASPAIVEIDNVEVGGSGTGFIFDGRGYILTNFHVVDGAAEVHVNLDDGTVLIGRVLGSDPSNDLAVVKVDPQARSLRVLPLGDSDTVEPGEPAIAIGFPLGEGKSVTAGIVSGKNRASESPSGWQQLGMLQTDAALNPGNSGGPLLDATGQVIGINAQVRVDAAGIGLAVPINTAKKMLPDMMENKTVQHAWLGISGARVTSLVASQFQLPSNRGVVLYEVLSGGAAEEAGLQAAVRRWDGGISLGDVIVAVNTLRVDTVEAIASFLQTKRPGDRVSLTVLRNGKEIQVPVTLKARPVELR